MIRVDERQYIVTKVSESNEDLQHYGVLGMKWGVRHANKQYAKSTTKSERQKATDKLNTHMDKASKKLNKLDTKAEKSRGKAEKKYYKYTKAAGRGVLLRNSSKIRKAKQKFKRSDAKYANKVTKVNEWYKAMEKEFGNTNVKITSQQAEIGKKYLEAMEYRLSRSGFDRY